MTHPSQQNNPLRVSVTTLGCKANQYDSSALEDVLRDASLVVVPFPAMAEAYVINTCTVTEKTDYQSRRLVRKARKLNPDAVVIVTGCYAQVSSSELAMVDGIDYVIGNPEKGRIVEFIRGGRRSAPLVEVGRYEDGTSLALRSRSAGGRTRANLKVQEGCDRACSYCIIPKARGLSRSVSLKEALRDIDALVDASFKEIVLTGIHLGAYGGDLTPPSNVLALFREIEANRYPCRFRISSLDPDEVTDDLIAFLAESKTFCNHLHLPLQSGDDTILRAMRRPYTREEFADKVFRLIESVKDISIGADIIAGFPGEGEREFDNSYSLVASLPISYLHIFPYSKRRGTPASSYKGQVLPDAVKGRIERLQPLDAEKRRSFYEKSVGKTAEVLAELSRDKKTGLLRGRSANYIPVLFDGPESLKNTIVKVRFASYDATGMTGATGQGEQGL
ncbi:MAG: tRNA (N(6)-L-threonylcarbamoyladenosine(37)-C(2))-methylthiotransferase MtaB [Deltaproteobacteria bacterium]|nr:tRNA (N(6)-L-threonylcarbamoyladenosine(37)-C(2))-methylthiotransferase MtaB [Deltaproteobacteria bacterium]